MNAFESFTVDGLTVKIHADEDPQNPRKEYDNAGTMVCWHRRYDLGDKHQFSDPEEFRAWAEENKALVLPLFLYDHSGITMSTGEFSCPWDSGQVGYIYVLPAKIKEEWGDGPEAETKAREYLIGEVETYDQYLTGDVWGYTVEDEDGEDLDSCWGFFGIKWARDEATSAAECCAAGRRKEKQAKLKAQIINRVPLARRGA